MVLAKEEPEAVVGGELEKEAIQPDISQLPQLAQLSQPSAASPANTLIPDPPPPASDTGADAGSEAPVNPRKRKKASRASVMLLLSHP